MAYVQLPNGSYLEVPKGMQPIQALQEARSAFPRAFMSEEELSAKQGFVPAAGQAFGEFAARSAEGLGALLDSDTLKKYAKDKQKELDESASYMPTEEGDVEAAKKQGLLPWAGAALAKHVTEPLGGIAGRYGLPMAAQALGPVGRVLGPVVDYPAEVGENLERMRQQGKPEDVTSAALWGAGQAALLSMGIPNGSKIMQAAQKYLGPEIKTLSEGIVAGTVKKEEALARLNSTARNIAQRTAGAAVQGAGLMVGTEAMRRASAGQDVASPEAQEAYKESLIGAAELAPLFGIPHGAFTRRGQVKQVESAARERQKVEDREKRAREDAEAAAQADALDAEKYNRAVMDTFGAPERPAEGVQGRTADMFGGTYAAPEGALPPQMGRTAERTTTPEREQAIKRAELEQVQQQLAENAQQQKTAATITADTGFTPFETGRGGRPLEITDAEGNKVNMTDTGALRGQGVLLERQLDAMKPKTPQEVMSQERNLKQYVTGLRDQVSAAAAKADIKTLGELTPKLKEVEAAYAAAYKEYSALDIPELKFQQLTDQIARKTKELQKAGGAQGDFAKIEKLTNDIQKLQTELEKVKPPSGPDLFGVAKEQRINEEIGKYEDELGARGEDQQRTAEQNRLRKEETTRAMREIDINAAFDKYMPSKLAEQLVNESDRSAAARKITRAETSDVINAQELEANQQRVARVTAAYKEAVAKAEETREPLMLAQNKATVALEKAQETAKARIQRAVDEGVNKRNVNTLRKRLDREMQPLVDAVNKTTAEAARPAELVKQLEKRLADAQQAGARPQVENRRNQALEDQQTAIEELRSQVEDLKSGRYFGKDARDRATAASTKEGLERKTNETIGRYVEAAIRDVNAAREMGGGKRMTLDEATRLAMDTRGHLENAVRNLNVSALRMPKESTVSAIERQLAQIKKKHVKIEPVEKKRAEGFALRPEFEVKKAEATKKLAELRKAGKADTEEYKKLQERLQGAPFETEARKTERLAEEEKERVAKERMVANVGNVEQRNLFGEKDLEPIATTRASAENFMKLLRSGTVSNMRAKIASIEKAKQEAQKIEETAKRGYSIQHNYDATYERLKNLEDTAKALEKSLDDLLMAPGQARNAIVAEKARLESVKARAAEQVKASEEKLKALEERKAKTTPSLELAEELTPKKEAELRAIDEQIKEEQRKAKAALEAIKEEAHPVFKIDELQEALKKADESHPQQLAVFDKIKDALRTRIKDLLETKVEAEKTLMKDAWEHTKQKVAAAKTVAEKNAVQAKAEKEKRLAEDRIAQSEQALRENAAKVQRENEQREFENAKLLRTTRKEMVGTKYKTQNVRELKRKEQLELALGKERDAPNPDQTKIIRLERQIAALETTREVTRGKVTREVPLATEVMKRETQEERRLAAVEELKEKKATQLERAEQKSEREKLLQKESALNKQLKQIRDQMGAAIKQRKTIENNIAKARKENTKAKWETALKEHDKKFNLGKLETAEQKVKDELADVAQYGVKTERALEVIGPKAGREQRTRVKGERVTQKDRDLLAELSDLAGLAKNVEEPRAPGAYSQQYTGISGNRYRAVLQKESRLDPILSKRVTDIIEKNVPKDVNVRSVESFAELPKDVKEVLARDGFEEGSKQAETVQGFATEKGDVYVIRGRHATLKELETTYVHEIIGHVGVDRILGKEGMEKLADRIRTQDGGAYELATKLGAGVRKNFESSMADYTLAIEEMKRRGDPQSKIDAVIKEMDVKAAKELIAYTAELRVDENLRAKAGRWMKEIVGAVRQWLRDNGFAELSKVSTSDIYNIIRQSQRNFNRGELGAFREPSGQVSFRSKQAKFNDSFDPELSKSIQQTVPSQKPWLDRIFGNAMGMTMMHRFEDNFAGLAHMATVNKRLTGSIEGTQMMYFNRLSHNVSNMVGEWVTHGPVGIAMTRGKKGDPTAEYQYVNKTEKYKLELAEERASKTPDKTKIADLEQKIKTGINGLAPAYEAIGKAAPEIGNTEAAFQAFTYYMAGERVTGLAQREGISFKEALKKLDLGEKLSEADVQRGLQFGRNNKHFQEARKLNKVYNDAQIDFLVETGYLTPAKAAELKKGDFVPFYRERNGEIVDNEYNIRVGDLTTQKHLKELIGGDQPILPFHISSLQNTRMLAEMGMKNIATKNTAYTLNNWGIAEVRPGDGPAAPNVIRFYDKGEKKHAILNFKDAYVGIEKKLEEMKKDGKANTPEYKALREKAEASRENSSLFGDIPAELVVKGMEGIALTLPAAVSWLRGPANLLRKGVTRNPLYAVRSLYKESLSSWITTGADVTPLLSSLKAAKQVMGKETPTTLKELQAAGITGGHVYSGTMSDLNTIALQIASGKSGWEKTWAGLDRLALRADEAGRVALYDGFIKKGMSQMEAQLATLESQNFTKRGYSPTMSMLSVMIPFFNSQVSGLSTFIRNMAGKSLFEDKLDLQKTAMMRGAVMAGSTLLYTALMQNNKAYKNATDEQRLNNWFVPIPFFEEPLRVAIPFEAGTVFKAVPEAIYNLMATDAKAKFVLPALRDQILQSVPGYSSRFMPQGVKPIFEAYTNKDFFTGQDIESKRQLDELPGYRENANTTEAAKAFGKLTGVSPIQLDHAISAYTGGAGIAVLSMLNPVLRSSTPPDLKPSQYAVLGSSFQPVDGAGIINHAFKEAEAIAQINKTFKNLEEKNPSEALAFANKNIRAIDFGSDAERFKRKMGEYAKEEREIRALPPSAMSSAEKTRLIDKIKQEKIEYAKEFRSSVNG